MKEHLISEQNRVFQFLYGYGSDKRVIDHFPLHKDAHGNETVHVHPNGNGR